MLLARYAVLFKGHFWDGFVQRQLERLRARVGGGDLFVFLDETRGPVGDVGHDPAFVLRATEADAEALGLARSGHASEFWFSADYALHLLRQRAPDYDHFVMVEFDVVVQIDLDTMLEAVAREEIDFVGQPIADPPIEEFHWLSSATEAYDIGDMRHWLTCVSVFSRRAAELLFARRLLLSDRLRSGEITRWPMCEIAVATEINLGGLHMKPLEYFGSLEFFRWAPPFDEARLPKLAAGAFVHPVLDAARFVTKILAWTAGYHEEFFDRDSPIWEYFGDAEAKRLVLPLLFDEERRKLRFSYRSRIIEMMHEEGETDYLAFHGRDGRNVALGKQTTQSSWIVGRPPAELAHEAVAGVVTGTATFHTEAEFRPWWMVDLEMRTEIEEVRVFNRMDMRERADGLAVLTSDDLREWREAGRHAGESFGGADGRPLVVRVGYAARFVRVELPETEYLHLDQVQVIRPRRG